VLPHDGIVFTKCYFMLCLSWILRCRVEKSCPCLAEQFHHDTSSLLFIYLRDGERSSSALLGVSTKKKKELELKN
jgi:hypothetical protein